MIRNLIRFGAVAGVTFGLAACDLDVRNPNDPETERVLASAVDAEALLGSYYRRWHSGVYGNTISNFNGMAAVMSLENYSSLANNGQNARASIPRPGNDNNVSNAYAAEQQRLYFIMGEVNRVASNVYNATLADGFSIGASAARKLRMQSFAQFLRGLSIGYTALFYDSGSVVTIGQAGDDPGPIIGYNEMMDSALSAMDSAISLAAQSDAATGSEGFPIPQEWIPTNDDLDAAYFTRLVRSYKARFRAGVARNPTERAAVNWTAVIADATNGITQDHDNITSTTAGPFYGWGAQWQSRGLWHQMPPFFIGMADNLSGNYEAWIAQPLNDRGTTGPLLVVSSDLRFPQGATRAAQQADFLYTSCDGATSTCERYFVNRPSNEDQTAGVTWGQSQYDFVLPRPWAVATGGSAQNGPYVFMRKAEIDMLAAEGYIRANDLASAVALINLTRTAPLDGAGKAQGGGLPAITTAADGGITGAGCIPEIPVAAVHGGGGTVVCAGAAPAHAFAPNRAHFEAMKYEKRLETVQSHFGAWYIDGRGWGDIPEGTPVQWATPYQDLQARQRPIYSIGGAGSPGSAPQSVYGW
jgi:hypothetical protein